MIPQPAVNDGKPAAKPAVTTSYVKPEPKEAAIERSPETPVAKPIEQAAAPKAVEAAPVPAKTPEPAKVETVEVKDSTVAVKATPAPVAKPVPVTKAPEPKPVVTPVPTPAAKPAPATVSAGNYKIQLGAFGSDAEARQNWSKITAKHGDVVKGSPLIVVADVNGKTYYRLRAIGFNTADDAKAACTKLVSRGQGCFPAGK